MKWYQDKNGWYLHEVAEDYIEAYDDVGCIKLGLRYRLALEVHNFKTQMGEIRMAPSLAYRSDLSVIEPILPTPLSRWATLEDLRRHGFIPRPMNKLERLLVLNIVE
jgi:hypothetical protein